MAVRPIDGNELVDTLNQIVSDYTSHGMYPSTFPVEYVIGIVEKMPTLAPPNEPLTWGELAEMEGQPVYIVEMGARRYWALVMFVSKDAADFVTVDNPDDYGDKELYGESWVAYRRPQEGEVKPTERPNV